MKDFENIITPNTSIRLGVNIDHVATIRNARGGDHPNPFKAAEIAIKAGADVITVHLREDRRHIVDEDVQILINKIKKPINLEIAPTEEMINFACKYKPKSVCIVPENREEKTTEGGLDVFNLSEKLEPMTKKLISEGIKVSLFIEPDPYQIDAAYKLDVTVVELHTGKYSSKDKKVSLNSLNMIRSSAKKVFEMGMECHAGHGLTFNNVKKIAEINEIVELNIGHFLIGEGIFIGLSNAIKEMKSIILSSRYRKKI